MFRTKFLLPLLALLSLGASQCPTRVTGGGTLNGDATIAFTANSCSDPAKGEFEYVSRTTPVKFHGDVDQVNQCAVLVDDSTGEIVSTCARCEALRTLVDPSGPVFGTGTNDSEIDISYRSSAGNGQAIACVSNNGHGADSASIQALTGPYAGYVNSGAVQGNIQQHDCGKKSGS